LTRTYGREDFETEVSSSDDVMDPQHVPIEIHADGHGIVDCYIANVRVAQIFLYDQMTYTVSYDSSSGHFFIHDKANQTATIPPRDAEPDSTTSP